jgi:hypothetical protein
MASQAKGDTMPVSQHDFRIIWSQDGREYGERTGGTRRCPLEGCTGLRIYVRWPDGRITYPCTKGLIERSDGTWQIG